MPSILIKYGRQASEQSLIIEQTDYAPFTGRLSRLAVGVLLSNLIYGTDEQVPVDCGFDGDCFQTVVLVYPSDPEMRFTMHLSHGSLSDGVVGEVERREILRFRLGSAFASYPVREIVSARWLGELYDSRFSPLPAVALELQGREVRTGRPVYGSLELVYRTVCGRYQALVGARDEAEENSYSSVVYGVHSGGVDWLRLKTPPGADEFEGDCLYRGGSVSVTPDDPPADPDGGGASRHLVLDYCTRQVISDSVF